MVNSGNVGAKRHVLNVRKGDVEVEIGTDDIDVLMRSGWAKGVFGGEVKEEVAGLEFEGKVRRELVEQRERMNALQDLLTDVVQQMKAQQRVMSERLVVPVSEQMLSQQSQSIRSPLPLQQQPQQPSSVRPPVRDARAMLRQPSGGEFMELSPNDMKVEVWEKMSDGERDEWQNRWLSGS